MKNILITSPNNQTLVSTVYSLRDAFYCKLFGIDRKKNTLSKHLLDKSAVFETDDDEVYVNKIKRICEKYGIQAIIPHSIKDRLLLMKEKSFFDELKIPILSSSYSSIMIAENKINFAQVCTEIGIPVPEQYVVNNASDLKRYAKLLGYPTKKVIVKPVVSKGGRGFRILNENLNMKNMFYTENKEINQITLKGLIDIVGDDFPDLIISEFLPGKEYSVDCLRHGDFFVAVPRIRVETRQGLTSYGVLEHNVDLIEKSKLIAEKMDLSSVFGLQFMEDANGVLKALECNPRIQGTMIMSTLSGANLIALGLKIQWGKNPAFPEIDWDMEFMRLWGGISIGEKKIPIRVELR